MDADLCRRNIQETTDWTVHGFQLDTRKVGADLGLKYPFAAHTGRRVQ